MGLIGRFVLYVILTLLIFGYVKAHSMTIYDDNGGKVLEYIIKKNHADKIEIFGKCYSACTVYLKHPNVCAGDKATFFIHAPKPDTMNNRRALVNQYPQWLQDWIRYDGGLTKDFKVIPDQLIRRYVKRC